MVKERLLSIGFLDFLDGGFGAHAEDFVRVDAWWFVHFAFEWVVVLLVVFFFSCHGGEWCGVVLVLEACAGEAVEERVTRRVEAFNFNRGADPCTRYGNLCNPKLYEVSLSP